MKLRLILGLAVVLVALTAVFLVTRPEEPEPEPVPPKLWSFQFVELERVTIELPRRDLQETWFKAEDKQWYFAEPDGAPVSHQRWGGGIPVILSGPRTSRAIALDATEEQLESFGLVDPAMRIEMTVEAGDTLFVDVGDASPTGLAYYFRVAGTTDVYTIDYLWYETLERLVTDPPYVEE